MQLNNSVIKQTPYKGYNSKANLSPRLNKHRRVGVQHSMTGTFTLNTLESGFWISFYAMAITIYFYPLPILIPGKDVTELRGKVHIFR